MNSQTLAKYILRQRPCHYQQQQKNTVWVCLYMTQWVGVAYIPEVGLHSVDRLPP